MPSKRPLTTHPITEERCACANVKTFTMVVWREADPVVRDRSPDTPWNPRQLKVRTRLKWVGLRHRQPSPAAIESSSVSLRGMRPACLRWPLEVLCWCFPGCGCALFGLWRCGRFSSVCLWWIAVWGFGLWEIYVSFGNWIFVGFEILIRFLIR